MASLVKYGVTDNRIVTDTSSIFKSNVFGSWTTKNGRALETF